MIVPSVTGSIRCHIRSVMLLPPAPSTKECRQSAKRRGRPSLSDKAYGAAVSGSAPITFTSGRLALIPLPTPLMRPPPPIGTITVTLDQTRDAMRLLAEKARVVAEGAGALALAAALTGEAGEGPIVCIVSGGNIDLAKFGELVTDR